MIPSLTQTALIRWIGAVFLCNMHRSGVIFLAVAHPDCPLKNKNPDGTMKEKEEDFIPKNQGVSGQNPRGKTEGEAL